MLHIVAISEAVVIFWLFSGSPKNAEESRIADGHFLVVFMLVLKEKGMSDDVYFIFIR